MSCLACDGLYLSPPPGDMLPSSLGLFAFIDIPINGMICLSFRCSVPELSITNVSCLHSILIGRTSGHLKIKHKRIWIVGYKKWNPTWSFLSISFWVNRGNRSQITITRSSISHTALKFLRSLIEAMAATRSFSTRLW